MTFSASGVRVPPFFVDEVLVLLPRTCAVWLVAIFLDNSRCFLIAAEQGLNIQEVLSDFFSSPFSFEIPLKLFKNFVFGDKCVSLWFLDFVDDIKGMTSSPESSNPSCVVMNYPLVIGD